MKSMLPIVLFVLILLCAGCATNYKSVNLNSIRYSPVLAKDSVSVVYNTNSLLESANPRYHSYLRQNNMTLVAVKIKNNTELPILINAQNLSITANGNDVRILDNTVSVSAIHQPGYLYLLWSFLFLNISTSTSEDGQIDSSGSIPIPIGLLIGLTNVSKSNSADKRFREQVIQNNMIGKTIDPGAESYGFLCVSGSYGGNLVFRYLK